MAEHAQPDARPAGPLLASFRLPLNARAPKCARDLAVQVAWGWGLEDITWTVRLAVSELVTNALLHGRAGHGANVVVELLRAGKRLRVAVHDPSRTPPRACPPAELRENGRGLHLVSVATDASGFEPTPYGKAVWFEIRADWPTDVAGRF